MLLSWCGWHMQVLCNFMKMLTWACDEAFGHHGGTKRVPRRRNKNGATATYPKMMPRQHIRKWCHGNISVPVAHGDTGAKEVGVSESCKMVGCPRIPGSHGMAAWKTSDNSDTVQTYGSSHTCKGISSRSSRVIPLKRAFPGGTSSERCRGSRRSWDVVEVVVLVS